MQDIDRDSLGPIQKFIAQAEVGARSTRRYEVHLREYARWIALVVKRTPATATPGDARRYMAYLKSSDRIAAAKHHRTSGALSPSSRKNILSSIHELYRYLVLVDVIARDPSASIKPPRVPHVPGLHLEHEEVRAILDARGGAPRERIQAYLLADTAARAGELRSLRWSDVDLQHRAITLVGKRGKAHIVDNHPRHRPRAAHAHG